jgi:prepilin-type N-terminal cleavage/methylation domain-containing protein
MKRLIKQMSGSSKGFSLTEVLIAIVILGVAGATIINGMTTDTKVRNKTNITTNTSIDLNSAAEILLSSKLNFAPCNSNARSYYENKFNIQFPNIVITKVEGLKLASPSGWVNCAITSAQTSIQKIYLKTSNENKINYEKQILVTDKSNVSNLQNPFVIVADTNQVTVTTDNTSHCASSASVILSNSLSSSQVGYFATSKDPAIAQATVVGSTLTVLGKSQGDTTVDVQGYSINQDTITSITIPVKVKVLSAISFSSPNQLISVLGHRRTLSTSNIFNLAAVPPGYTYSVAFNDTNSLSPFQLISLSNGTFDWKSLTPSESVGVYINQVKISINGLPNPGGCTDSTWRIPIQINPELTFSLDLSRGDKCVLGTTQSCAIPITSSGGSGSGLVADSGSNSYSNGKISISGSSCSTPFTSFQKFSNSIPSLSNVSGSGNTKVQLYMNLSSSEITTMKLAKTANLTFSRNGKSTPNPLQSWNLDSVSQISESTLTSIVLSKSGSSIDVSSYSPSGLQLLTFNDIKPTLYDNNFSNLAQGTSYRVMSSNQLPISCN